MGALSFNKVGSGPGLRGSKVSGVEDAVVERVSFRTELFGECFPEFS